MESVHFNEEFNGELLDLHTAAPGLPQEDPENAPSPPPRPEQAPAGLGGPNESVLNRPETMEMT